MKQLKFLSLLLFLFFTGCASFTDLPAGTIQTITVSPVLEQQAVSVEIPVSLETIPPAAEYQLGPGDVLFINVNGMPELSSPVLTGSSRLTGSRIDGAGDIRLPMVGRVQVAGLTLGQVEAKLREVFSRYLNDPWVVIEVSEYKSQPLYLLGQFRNAGVFYMEHPLTLLNGLSLGGGLLDSANLRSARLMRNGKIQPVDIYQLLREGSRGLNVWLAAGDTIYVPDDKNQNVFVFGAVSKPGPVVMPNGQLNLSQALASAGVGETRGNTEQIRIIRSLSPTRGELIVVDQDSVLRGRSLPYTLAEGDIIYVPRSGVGNWNQVLQELLPSLQTFSAILQPFVSIKYLENN
jgi:polysaccharide export outer membrane protein